MLYRQQDYCKHINHLSRWKFLHHLRISSLYGFASVSHLWIIRSKTTSFMDVSVRAGQILWVPGWRMSGVIWASKRRRTIIHAWCYLMSHSEVENMTFLS
jgi:hypothetical protein